VLLTGLHSQDFAEFSGVRSFRLCSDRYILSPEILSVENEFS
jgi:hypothetical protein